MTMIGKKLSLAVLAISIALLITGGTATEPQIKLETGVDRQGMNYNSYTLSSADPQLCANDCENDPKCEAFTYVNPGVRGANSPAECWLKDGVPDPVSSECCVSGVKSLMQKTYGTPLIDEYNARINAPSSTIYSESASIACFSSGNTVGSIYFYPDNSQLPPNEVVKNPLNPNTPLVRLSFPISQFNQVLSLVQSGGAALYFYPASPNDSFIAIKKTHVGYTVS